MSDSGPDATYHIMVNDEEPYSNWLAQRPLTAGWRAAGFAGTRGACLAQFETVWTDMRPAGLRRGRQS